MLGGQLAPMPTAQTRWYQSDLEAAEHAASSQGDLAGAARLMRAAGRDGILAGVMSTRTLGLVRLPKRFRGDPEIVAELELGHQDETGEVRSKFTEMFPPQELALLAKLLEEQLLALGGEVGRQTQAFERHVRAKALMVRPINDREAALRDDLVDAEDSCLHRS